METEDVLSPSPNVETPQSLNFDFNLEIEDFSSDVKTPLSSSARSPVIPIPKTLDITSGKSVPEFNSICCKVGSTTTSEDLIFSESFIGTNRPSKSELRYNHYYTPNFLIAILLNHSSPEFILYYINHGYQL